MLQQTCLRIIHGSCLNKPSLTLLLGHRRGSTMFYTFRIVLAGTGSLSSDNPALTKYNSSSRPSIPALTGVR